MAPLALNDASARPRAVARASSGASSRLAPMPSAAHATMPAGTRPHCGRNADTISAASPHVMTRR